MWPSIKAAFFYGFLLSWLGAVVAGTLYMVDYSSSPGSPGVPAARWPEETMVATGDAPLRLVMGAHPRCPCTRASIEELARIMARQRSTIEAHVVFWAPGENAGWARTASWTSAAAIPGVSVYVDPEGAATERFGIKTSGHTLVYSQEGRLLFSGGITASRGHEGANRGRNAILDLASGGEVRITESPVFGCAIFEPGEGGSEL